jgi:sulfide:quinone oxidoreductase
MPIKCPVAPIEFVFLADWYLRERRIRDHTELVLSTPLDGCFTRPIATKHLSHLLERKGIELRVEFAAGEVDGAGGVLRSCDGREQPFDLLVTIPMHGGAEFVDRSPGLSDALGFVQTDPHTLQAEARANVFALGDAADLPTSKAGSVTHFQGDVLADNIARFLEGRELLPRFDGHSNCFIETGYSKALLIDFNYDLEPVPGGLPHRSVAVDRGARRADRRRERDPGADRPALARRPLHARPLSRHRNRPVDPVARQGVGRPIKELYQLFPKGPAKLAAKIGGIPKPKGCI